MHRDLYRHECNQFSFTGVAGTSVVIAAGLPGAFKIEGRGGVNGCYHRVVDFVFIDTAMNAAGSEIQILRVELFFHDVGFRRGALRRGFF